MSRLPKVVASSVIRSSHQGESHGGVYIVDLQTGSFEQTIDWNEEGIDWEGRGGDRGLRGIAFHRGRVFLAASDEIFCYDPGFRLIGRYRNRYLKHCHEILAADGRLFITSTGFDSVIVFDLATETFVQGYCLRYGAVASALRRGLRRAEFRLKPRLSVFDPNSGRGPAPGDTTHINSVFWEDGVIYVAGCRFGLLLGVCVDGSSKRLTGSAAENTKGDDLFTYGRLSFLTHNARPFHRPRGSAPAGNLASLHARGSLLNDTASDQVRYLTREGEEIESFTIPRYEQSAMSMADLPQDHARQAFGRGLCLFGDDVVIGGSSPATVSVYQFGRGPEALKTVRLSDDVRNAIHGLEIWPF